MMQRRHATAAGAALLLGVVLVHFRYGDLAAWLYGPQAAYASRALFYVLRGLEGAALFGLLMWLAPPSVLLRLACAVGLLAEMSTALCRAAWPLTAPVPPGADAGGLCDAATREPITAALAGVVLVALLFMCNNNTKAPP